MTNPQRLASLDAFRGFAIASMVLVNNPGSWKYVYGPLAHSEWNGCTFTDLVFPFFLFAAGLSMTISLGKKAHEGSDRLAMLRSLARRASIIFFIGVALNFIPSFALVSLRIPGGIQLGNVRGRLGDVEEKVVRQGLGGLRGTAILASLVLAILVGCANHVPPTPFQPRTPPAPSSVPPPAPREFRAAWVATVANIDWPSHPGMTVEAQKKEARDIIALARSLGLNALILQVRPSADALYASQLEPWSEFLTGEQGKAPDPSYDPLAFWIKEAHDAGIELHAWFNPFRARHPSARSPLAANHVGSTRPDLVRTYGDQLWLDPGEPDAVQHVLAVIRDVARRYDVDGIHIDDYFYPYPIEDPTGQPIDFPDEHAWQAFLAGGGTLSRADWRRQNVDKFIERLYQEVHQEKPLVRVGVSPFGLGRADQRPTGVTGFSQYDEIYADVELWLERGWLDYLAPQLYWPRSAPGQPFGTLLDYWRAQNPKGRHVWPGLYTSRTGMSDPWPTEEITEQIQLIRTCGGSTGHAHFSMAALKKDYGGITESLGGIYDGPALVPATGWLGDVAPSAPAARLGKFSTDASTVRVELITGDAPWLLAVWGRYGGAWRFFILPNGVGALPVQSGGHRLDLAFASVVGRTGLESPRMAVKDER